MPKNSDGKAGWPILLLLRVFYFLPYWDSFKVFP